MDLIANQLSDLKFSLQELESAVQQPRDERFSVEQVVDCFPKVLSKMSDVVTSILLYHGVAVEHPRDAFNQAHARGWLKGDLALWLRLISDYQQLKEEETHGARARAVAQDVRACSCVLWETYEILMARFRSQTQTHPVGKSIGAGGVKQYASQLM